LSSSPEQSGGNPASFPSLAQVQLEFPKNMTVRLTNTGRLALTDIGVLFFSIFLTLAVTFATSYFADKKPRPQSLMLEAIAWVALTIVTLVIVLVLRYRMYTEETEKVIYEALPTLAPTGDSSRQGGQGVPVPREQTVVDEPVET
jgi:hypothetical protein